MTAATQMTTCGHLAGSWLRLQGGGALPHVCSTEGVSWHPEGGGRECCSRSCNVQDSLYYRE